MLFIYLFINNILFIYIIIQKKKKKKKKKKNHQIKGTFLLLTSLHRKYLYLIFYCYFFLNIKENEIRIDHLLFYIQGI